MVNSITDILMFTFSLVFYLLLTVIYILRAKNLSNTELKLAKIYSAQLIPFILLWFVNLIEGRDTSRLIAGLPIILYLGYDFWYRLYTKKKPVHHPDKMPRELIIYIILLQIGSIGLNWYAYLISEVFGIIMVVSYFVTMAAFSYYQYRYNQRKKPTPMEGLT